MNSPLSVQYAAATPSSGPFADAGLVARFLLTSRICALAVALFGALVLVGWRFDIGLLKSIAPHLSAMAPNSALAFVLLGAGLWLMHPARNGAGARRLAAALPMAAVLISGLTLAEYVSGESLGIDQFLFPDPTQAVQTAHPGRMAVVTACEFLLLGLAQLLVGVESRPAHRLARALALATSVMSLMGLLGFLYGKSSLYAMPVFTGIALHTVVAFLILAAGILAIQPARGFTTMLTSAGEGGRLSRRLLPYAIVLPPALGWLRLEGERTGFYQAAMGVDLMVVVMVMIFTALIWWNSRLLEAAGTERMRADAERRKSADEVRDLYEHAPCGYHSLDYDGRFVRINDTELSWLGYARDEILGKRSFAELLTPESRTAFQDQFPQLEAQGGINNLELEMQRKDGSLLPVLVNATAVRDAAGRYVKSRSTVVDITERRRAEQALRRSGELVRLRLAEIEQIYRYAPVGLFIFDREYRFQRINERMAEINGFPPEAHIGKSMWEIVPDLAGQLKEIYRPVFEHGEPVLDVEIHGRTPRDPETIHDWLGSYFPLKSESGEVIGLIGAVLDISERKRTEEALRESEAEVRRLALTDPLTGLANRRRLDETLLVEIHRVQRYGGRLSAVMADLDHFKRINDLHGHHVGDVVLREFARIVQSHCRDTDLVARFGGEEFVILMPEVGVAEANACAERMRATLAQSTIPPLAQPVTASFGVAELMPGEGSDSLVRRADQALYAGKTAGRNRVIEADSAGFPR